jgi:cytochrome b561
MIIDYDSQKHSRKIMNKYTKSFVTLHWLHAILLAFLLIGASLKMPDLPKVGGDLSPFALHMLVGAVATLLLFVRWFMSRSQARFVLYETSKQKLVDWNHRLIYLTIAIVGLSGMTTAKVSNLGSVAIFGSDATNYTGPTSLVSTFAQIHSVSTIVLMALIAMHVVGVILYLIQTKTNIIQRMWY